MVNPKLKYADLPLAQAGDRRKDGDWLAKRHARSDSCVVPVWRDRNLLDDMAEKALPTGASPLETALEAPAVSAVSAASAVSATSTVRALCEGDAAKRMLDSGGETVFLGMQDDRAVFAVDLSGCEEDEAAVMAGGGTFVDLRRIGPFIDAPAAALMAYARGMIYWHRGNGFCGRCGHATESRDGGHRRQCTRAECGRMAFPRTDPAVIMLVEHRPDDGRPPVCLLGNHYRRPGNVYSTLAGFVEPGESLEETVAREVFEEVGIRVSAVSYQASQPWPFPSSIMLGYRARAETTEIVVDRQELKEARWFTAEEIRDFGEWGDELAAHALPRRDAIARFLVDAWVCEVSAC